MIEHAGINRNEADSRMEACMSEFSVVRHEGMKRGLEMTGTHCVTYMEIARDAFLKYYRDSFMELKNVILMDKLPLDNDTPPEVRTVIKKESDHLEFIISSKAESGADEPEAPWLKHSEGAMYRAGEAVAMEYTMEEIKNRCSKRNKAVCIKMGETKKSANEYNSTAYIYEGIGEALVKFELPGEDDGGSKGSILHPCLMDYIIDTCIRNIAPEGWSPISYKRLIRYREITGESYAYIREYGGRDKEENSAREVNYDITVFDPAMNIIVKIEEYKVGYGEEAGKVSNPVAQEENGLEAYADFEPYAGSQRAKQGTQVEDISRGNNSFLYTSSLSWRQMNCRDRVLALLLGHKDERFVNFFKFFLGAKRGYDLKKFGLAESDSWFEEILHKKILSWFGYAINIVETGSSNNVHRIISEWIDKKEPVGVWFDEYYIYYTPFYLSSHTGHIAVINGCNKDKRIYSVLDHNHLKVNNSSQLVNYGQFYATYDMMENIYSNLDNAYRFVMTLVETTEEIPQSGKDGMEFLRQKSADMLNYLIESRQAGRDIDTICRNIGEKGGCFDVSSVDGLYYQLGGKELFIDTLFNYLCPENENSTQIKELGYKIIRDSNSLINRYVASMYRGKEISRDKVSDSVLNIENDTTSLFKEVLKHL